MDPENLVLYPLDCPQGTPLYRMLVSMAASHGWQGNLWQCYLTWVLTQAENPFSLACERREVKSDSLYQLALRDMEIYFDLFRREEPDAQWQILTNYRTDAAPGPIVPLSQALAKADTPEQMLTTLTDFYRSHGVGMLGLNQVFRLTDDGDLYPVTRRRPVHLTDLVGYEDQKKQLVANTLAFLRGHHANNVMLYGDACTGKSTSVQPSPRNTLPRACGS